MVNYMVCYRFNEKGRWYIHKDCKMDKLQETIESAFSVDGVVQVMVYPLEQKF